MAKSQTPNVGRGYDRRRGFDCCTRTSLCKLSGSRFNAIIQYNYCLNYTGLVGLAISYALSVTNLLSGVVTSFTETEKEMVSVERVMEYIRETPNERGNQHEEDSSSSQGEWPSRGVVEFKKVTLKYR